jgi:segregation and condensation protein B
MSDGDDEIEQEESAAEASGEPVAPAATTEAPPAATGEPLVETLDAAEARAALTPPAEEAAPEVAPDVSDLPPAELRAVVESLLFVATRPLTVDRLLQCLPGTSELYLERFLEGLAARYDHENRGWELKRIANGWQLLTRRAHYPWVRQLERKELPTKLSKSALETLAIVAYKQPITRGQIEDIRGVQCGPVLRQLMDLRLVQVTGRSEDVLGRPLLYGTTESFLGRFGLGALGDLPSKHEFGA